MLLRDPPVGPVHMSGSEHISTWESVCLCERACVRVSLGGSGSDAGASLGPLPAGLGQLPAGSASWRQAALAPWPVALWAAHLPILSSPRFRPFCHRRALFLQKRGLICSQILPQCTARFQEVGLGCLEGLGSQSLVGLLLSDGTVRQGLDTSRQGMGVREGRRRKKKEIGRLGYSCHCYQSPAFLGTLGGMWKGEKRQLKPVGVGPVPHPHAGHWSQLYPFCWTRMDRAPGASGGALASRSSPCGSPWPSVPALPGQRWQCPSSRASLSRSPYCPPSL